jgi:YegS/Rv2252/BmrU family lipid kinase
MFMRVSFIANPTAGRGRTRALVEQYANAVGAGAELLWTQGPGHATTLARDAAARGTDLVCAVGGDGTVSEVVNGLMPRPAPIVVVPTGSGNDFASLVDGPRSPAELSDMVRDGAGVLLDVIDCGGRYCANSVGIGFEAVVNYHSRSIRRLRGLPLYLLAVFKALAAYECIRYTLTVDGADTTGEFLLVSAGNGVRAGGGFYLNPDALPDDGMIDVCVARRMSRARMLTILPRALRGTHVAARGIETFRGASVTVAADEPFPVHIDGEYAGRMAGPLALRVVPRCLPVLTRRDGRARRSGALLQVLPRAGGV